MQHSWTDFSNRNILCSPWGTDYSLYVTQIILILKLRRLGFNTGSVRASLMSLGQIPSSAIGDYLCQLQSTNAPYSSLA